MYVSKGYNQVCIGIRKDINYKLLSVLSKNICDINIPELLQVDIEIERKKLSIVGIRIKIQNKTKSQQFEYLNRFKIRDYGHAYRLVFEYLEAFYNTKRIHSHCDYMSPNDYEELYRRVQQHELLMAG